jgi:hypothetical protein
MCPFCGIIGSYQLNPGGYWRVRCRNSECRVKLVLGIRVMVSRSGGGKHLRIPPDTVFPAVAVEEWRSGEPVNVVEVDRLDVSADVDQ